MQSNPAPRGDAITETASTPSRFVERRRKLRPTGGTKPVDLTYLGRFTLGNPEIEAEVLGLFETYAPAYLDQLKSAATVKAWHDAAHTLKGAARGIGAWRVSRCAEAAERLRFDTDLDRRAFAIDSVTEALDEALGYVRTLRVNRDRRL